MVLFYEKYMTMYHLVYPFHPKSNSLSTTNDVLEVVILETLDSRMLAFPLHLVSKGSSLLWESLCNTTRNESIKNENRGKQYSFRGKALSLLLSYSLLNNTRHGLQLVKSHQCTTLRKRISSTNYKLYGLLCTYKETF